MLAQRLVRTLCPHCRQPDEQGSQPLLADVIKPWKISAADLPLKPVGCVDCRMTGFRGRMGIYELLTVSDAFRTGCVPMSTWRRCASRRSPTACAHCGWPVRCAPPKA